MMKTTTIAGLGLLLAAGGAVGETVFQQWQQYDALRAPLLAALANPDAARFRHERLTRASSFLCGEVAVKGPARHAGFRRFISHVGGYAVEGKSIKTFYAPGDQSRFRLAELKVEVSLLKQHRWTARKTSVYKAEFANLWKLRCL